MERITNIEDMSVELGDIYVSDVPEVSVSGTFPYLKFNFGIPIREGIKNIREFYALSSDAEIPPISDWVEEPVPVPTNEQRYLWNYELIEYGDGSKVKRKPHVIGALGEQGIPGLPGPQGDRGEQGLPGVPGQDGQNAITLRIDSSRGTVFKTNAENFFTVLSVVIYYGPDRIENIKQLREAFGIGAYLEWSWLRIDEERYGVILSTDSRLSEDGFKFTISPEDVDTKVTFRCELKG